MVIANQNRHGALNHTQILTGDGRGTLYCTVLRRSHLKAIADSGQNLESGNLSVRAMQLLIARHTPADLNQAWTQPGQQMQLPRLLNIKGTEYTKNGDATWPSHPRRHRSFASSSIASHHVLPSHDQIAASTHQAWPGMKASAWRHQHEGMKASAWRHERARRPEAWPLGLRITGPDAVALCRCHGHLPSGQAPGKGLRQKPDVTAVRRAHEQDHPDCAHSFPPTASDLNHRQSTGRWQRGRLRSTQRLLDANRPAYTARWAVVTCWMLIPATTDAAT